MKNRLQYALRTLVGPWLLLPAIMLEVANFLQRGMPWRGEGMWTVEWFAISLFIIGPLCAGVAAVDAARLSQPGNIHLVVSVPRPARVYVRAAVWCAGPLIALHLLAIVTGVVVGQVREPSISWWAIIGAAAIQCAAILWSVALGSAIGRFMTPLLAGLAGGAGALVLSYVIGDAWSGDRFQLLALGAATISRIGYNYNHQYLIGQATVFGVTALLLLVLPLRSRSGFRIPKVSGVIAGTLAVMIVALAPGLLPANRLIKTGSKPPTFCTGSAPEVCLYSEHRRFAGLINSQVQILARAAFDAGYPALVPERVMENSRVYIAGGPGIASLWLPPETYEQGRLSLDMLAYELVSPSHCEGLRSETPPSAKYDARFFSVLQTWLDLAKVAPDHGVPVPTKPLSPSDVATIMDQFARCDLDGDT